MRCPRDHAVLEAVSAAGVTTGRCAVCGGLWVPRAALHGFATQHAIELPAAGPGGAHTTGPACPADASPMQAVRHRGVELDVCRHCHGVWLDAGELERIRGLRGYGLAEAATDVAVQVAPDPSVLGEAIEAALGFLGDVFTGW